MPTTIRLTTVPGKIQKRPGYEALVIDLFGPSLGTELVIIMRTAEIASAVTRFGERIRAEHPNASFKVNVSIPNGTRKPAGFDAARNARLFGDDAFLHVDAEDFSLEQDANPTEVPAS